MIGPVAPIVGWHFDGKPLRIGNAIHVANPTDKAWTRHRYLVTFTCGYFTAAVILAYADGPDDALEVAGEYLADNLPGLLAEDPVTEEDEADLIYTESGWLDSASTYIQEDPSNDELRRLHGNAPRADRSDFRRYNP